MSLLVEPASTPGRYRVTFRWRPGAAGELAVVLINTLTDRDRHAGDISGHVMRPAAGGEVLEAVYELDGDLRASYQILPCAEVPGTDRASWLRALETAGPDPDNPVLVPASPGRRPSSLLELPGAPAQPYREARPGVARGRMTEHTVAGRRLWTYTPPNGPITTPAPGPAFTPSSTSAGHGGGPYPVVVFLDGDVWAERIGPTLDNLIAAGRIPPVVAVLPDAVDRPTRLRELACHEPFVRHLAEEVLPWAERELNASPDPQLTVIAGQSLGGLAASYAAYLAPERFGAVVSQSGSYWWSDADPEWLTRQYARSPRRMVRFYVEVGRLEWMLLGENRRFAETLAAQGYEVAFSEFAGGHDPACWLGGLARGLETVGAGWL
ncbi:alpha/beta hydrolase-fold protein [Nonomuraea sp. NPDC050328]|uniref:alpha/beta hydrolase-fold protein n=1 Tax=Nonomuraea sp. NPDC050328 TaxID=3364361 RepID=UPI00378A0068